MCLCALFLLFLITSNTCVSPYTAVPLITDIHIILSSQEDCITLHIIHLKAMIMSVLTQLCSALCLCLLGEFFMNEASTGSLFLHSIVKDYILN